MDREVLEHHLLHAEARVASGDRRVAKQRRLVARLERDGQDTSEARTLLAELEASRKLYCRPRSPTARPREIKRPLHPRAQDGPRRGASGRGQAVLPRPGTEADVIR